MMRVLCAALLALWALGGTTPAQAQFFSFFDDSYSNQSRSYQRGRAQRYRQQRSWWEDDDDDVRARRQSPDKLQGGPRPSIAASAPPVVRFKSDYKTGSIVIDTRGRTLYYVLSSDRAYRYRIAVGRQGFSWTGTQKISRKVSWPDWRPPEEMRERDPRLPILMTGGLNNPLGAKALYLGNTLYRIHGTNNAKSIGTASSSGCFRMTNANVLHLASIASVGAEVRVLKNLPASVRGSLAVGDDRSNKRQRNRNRS